MSAFNRNMAAALSDAFAPRNAEQPTSARRWLVPYRAIESVAVLADIGAILVSSLLADLLTRVGGRPIEFGKDLGAAMIVSALFVCLLKIHGLYRPVELLGLRKQAHAVVLAWTSVFALLAAAAVALEIVREIPRGAGMFAALGLVILVAHRAVLKQILLKGLSGRKFADRKIVLVTDQPISSTTGLAQAISTFSFAVVQSFALPPPGAGFEHRKRLSARVIDYVRGSDVEEIIIEADLNRWAELRSLVGDLRVLPFPINYVPVGVAAEVFRRPARELGRAECFELQRGPLTRTEYAAKRTLDVFGAALSLLLLSPLLLAAAVAIKLDSAGPILFRQQRCGFNGRSFTIRKFRTMYVLEDGPSVAQARPFDKRVTRVGKWLRRTSIDELPQLLNVLDGSMSLVGPRPHALAHENEFDKVVRNYAFRRRVKPGLTGWAQVHGCRGPTPTLAKIEQRVEYDLWYIDNWSLRLDTAILLQTPFEVLRGRNAH